MKLKNVIKGMLFVLFGILLLVCRDAAVGGMTQGIDTCLNVLVPSLFPFMVLSGVAVKCGIFQNSGKRAFSVLPVIIFGFTGGYPVGLNVAAELYENGVIDSKTVLRLSSFCVNAGPAFVLTAVGTMIFGSSEAGGRLFLCVCISSLITGLIASLFIKPDKGAKAYKYVRQPFSDAITKSVRESCEKMFVMCAWVMLFSCFSGILKEFEMGFLSDLWAVFSEVTAGVVAAEKTGGLPLAAACISSGGVCVMCQLLPAMKKCGVRIREYLTFRIVNSVISFILMKIMLMISPVSVEAFSYDNIPLGTGNGLSSVLLLITGVVFVTDMSSGKVRRLNSGDLF